MSRTVIRLLISYLHSQAWVYNAPTKNKNRRKLLVFDQKEKERNKRKEIKLLLSMKELSYVNIDTWTARIRHITGKNRNQYSLKPFFNLKKIYLFLSLSFVLYVYICVQLHACVCSWEFQESEAVFCKRKDVHNELISNNLIS